MSEDSKNVGQPERAGVIIPHGDPPTVEELAEREGLGPFEKLRREIESKFRAEKYEAELRERAKRYSDLQRMRRRLRDSIQTRESELRHDKRELAEIEREMSEIRLPPGLKVTVE